MSLDALVREKRLLVTVGPGGVGKTTIAAVLALAAAREGRRALVLTIDPARRLADALGLDGLDDRVRQVDVRALDLPGALSAAMLETRASYDALVRRIAEPAHAERIFENRVYRAFSRTLARSHAYVAMERLVDVERSGDFDIVILDTPPLRSALDILDAPARLVRFLDADIVRAFLDRIPSEDELHNPARLALGSAVALRLLSLVASRELVLEMVGFFSLFATLREGFTERAEHARTRLVGPEAAFVLVASPSSAQLEDARFLRDGLVSRGLLPSAIVVNRAYVSEPGTLDEPVRVRPEPAESPSAGVPPSSDEQRVRVRLAELRAAVATWNAAAESRARAFAPRLSTASLVLLPELPHTPTDLPALLDLARMVAR
jgi:anion-transporting  ArsA/GET3 family ATPase